VSYFPYVVAGWLFLVGLYGVVSSRNYVHLAVCLATMQSSTYVLLLAIGFKHNATAPIVKGVALGAKQVDPVVQALTLTDIVVSVTVAALLLALAIQAKRHADTMDPERLHPMRG
jgi:multicomponent Na+:H+ antiporter subunit C